MNTTACKRLFSLGCVAHTDGAVLQHHFADRTRTLKFAGFYMGEGADNFDMEKMMMRSPFNGALGAHTECTEFDWCTHRDQLSEYPTEGAAGHRGYLCPFLDHPIVPEGADWDYAIDWNNDEVFEDILRMVNTTACKRLFSLGCVPHTDGAVFQTRRGSLAKSSSCARSAWSKADK